MAYSQGHPIRLVGGRLALDFVNTADWSANGDIVHEKISSREDLTCWLGAAGLEQSELETEISELLGFRSALRKLLLGTGSPDILNEIQSLNISHNPNSVFFATRQPLMALLANSALAILVDRRELDRLKMCPADNCGWLFIDEKKNGRRKWCSMESCGNRAKAARHYVRSKQDG